MHWLYLEWVNRLAVFLFWTLVISFVALFIENLLDVTILQSVICFSVLFFSHNRIPCSHFQWLRGSFRIVKTGISPTFYLIVWSSILSNFCRVTIVTKDTMRVVWLKWSFFFAGNKRCKRRLIKKRIQVWLKPNRTYKIIVTQMTWES